MVARVRVPSFGERGGASLDPSRSPARLRGRAGVLVGAALLGGVTACSAPAERPHTPGTPSATKPNATASATTTSPSVEPPDPHRRPLGVAIEEALPVELATMAGGARVLAIADEGERGAWARTIDADGALSKPRWFEGAHVVTAMETSDGRATYVTSDGDRLCVSTFAKDGDAPSSHKCETARPEAVVPVGDRIALFYVDVSEAKATKARPSSGSSGAKKTKPSAPPKPSSQKKEEKKGGAKGSSSRTAGRLRADKPSPSTGATAAKPSGASGSTGGKSSRPVGHASKKPSTKKKSRAAEAIAQAAAKAKVDVRLAWVTRDGAFDATAKPVGLTFERPLAGMMLADVASRGPVADLLFFEAVAKPKVRSKTPLGSARLGIASVNADGDLVEGSRGTLSEGDLEYGYITGQNGPRLVANASGTAVLTFAGRSGACQATRVFPTFGPSVTPKAACLVDPLGAATAGAPAPSIEAIFAMDPRRAPGQVKSDGPLVAWAGDSAYFVGAAGFATASTSGAPVLRAPPFVAKRSRIAWSAFAPDGEGIAFTGGSLWRIDAGGGLSEIAGAAALDALGPRASGLARRAEGRDDDTRRAARIGDAFFLARGDVSRLWPSPAKIDVLAGRAVADASALVGGSSRGLFVEIGAGAMRVTYVAKDGSLTEGPRGKALVRAGFDAAERARGGAIVAGVDASDPAKVVAFTIDENGAVSAPRSTSLHVAPGAFGVRVTALPGGGAWLMDRARRRVVWLDDDANERGSSAIPADHARASCTFGRAAPTSIPSVEPGKLVAPPDLAQPGTCITGDVAWTPKGGLRWFGATVHGLDAIAEVASIEADPSTPTTPVSATSASAPVNATSANAANGAASASAPTAASDASSVNGSGPVATSQGDGAFRSSNVGGQPVAAATANNKNNPATKVACPGEMVSIAGRFCVDRFESTLVDQKTWRVLSPDFPATPNLLEIVLGDWATERAHWGDAHARAFPLPDVPSWQRGQKNEPVAVPLFGARPNGYVTGLVAESACAAAGKRLCTLDEFTTACRGENDTDFPYGDEYQDGVCNVYREDHPAGLLHHNASFGHLDPRLNRVRAKGRPLFEATGARAACRSTWGDDAVYDLVGNLDEWVDEGSGAFAGGFYSRSTRSGCDAVITAHPKVYADYSTGVRCCKDAAP